MIISEKYQSHLNIFEYKYVNFSKILYYSDKSDQYIIVSGKNYLLKFSIQNLSEPLAIRKFGPVNDSVLCTDPNACSVTSCRPDSKSDDQCKKKPTDVFVKSWTITNSDLIVCYNAYQGFCETIDVNSEFSSKSKGKGYSIVNHDLESHSTILHFQNKLFVAIEINTNLNFQFIDFNTISIRTLPNMKLIYSDFSMFHPNFGKLGSGSNTIYPLEFKGSFHFRDNRKRVIELDYIFFLVNQPENKLEHNNGKFQTRLVRICARDEDFTSFIDIGMFCENSQHYTYYQIDSWNLAYVSENLANWYRNNTRFPDIKNEMEADFHHILYINFKIIEISENYKTLLNSFVMCAFPMAEIMELFDIVKKRCFRGDGSVNPRPYDRNSNDVSCLTDETLSEKKGFCGGKYLNYHIIGDHYGSLSVVGYKLIAKDGLRGSSLIVFQIYENYTLAYVGGNDGNLYEYDLFGSGNQLLSTVKLFGGGDFNMVINENKSIVYAVANSRIVSHKLINCNPGSNCESCLRTSPFCGWCISTGKCVLRENCVISMWLQYERNRNIKTCPEISFLPSHSILEYLNNSPTIIFQIDKIPFTVISKNREFLKCQYIFNKDVQITVVKAYYYSNNNSIACKAPQKKFLPSINENTSFIHLKLRVLINESFLVDSSYYIHNCAHSKTCSSCTDNKFNCSWCVLDNLCVSSMVSKCKKNFEIQNNKPQACPKLEATNQTMAFHSGYPILITLKTTNFQNYLSSKTEFICLETCHNSTVIASLSTPARIICSFNKIKLGPSGVVKCYISISWRLANSLIGTIESSSPIQFQVFDCSKLSSYCDDCVLLPKIYQCGFCTIINKCVQKPNCDRNNIWIYTKTEICPLPAINEIIPGNSTLTSESVILIKGRNLGFFERDIQNAIYLESARLHVPCKFLDQLYISAKQFMCKIQNVTDRIDTPVSFQFVFRSKNYLAKREFNFFTPSIFSISPDLGPYIGGTIIKISGNFLNIGSKREIKFKSGSFYILCNILQNYQTYILCRLNEFSIRESNRPRRSPNSYKAILHFVIDQNIMQFNDIQFHFFPNPIVTKVSRKKFITNGGQIFRISGNNLYLINKPCVGFYCRNVSSIYENCVVNNSDIYCTSPKTFGIINSQDCLLIFGMENGMVSLYNTTIILFSTPNFTLSSSKINLPSTSFSFVRPKPIKKQVTIYLDINDKVSTSAFLESDLKISIGSISCTNISLEKNNIRCNIDINKIDIYRKYQLNLMIGKDTIFVPGLVQFEKGDISLDTISVIIIISIIIAILFGVILVAVIIVKKIQTKQRSKRERHNIFTEKIMKEANEILKRGITELNQAAIQDEIHKNWSDAPIHPYNVYILYNLFPNTHPRLFKESKNMNESIIDLNYYNYNCNEPSSHPLIFNKQIQVIENTIEYSRKLSRLFEDELFVLTFFTFLEEHQEVESKKSDIVSFLSLILMKDMSNYTRILKILIKNDYDKKKVNEEERSMFRQSDLLSKLLSNWFFILMYDHLQNINAGGDLLILYLNILNIVNKGPVNFDTNKCQYALNENSLLDRKIEFRRLNIKVKHDLCNSDSEVEVEVLDCDCIFQAKLKIFEDIYKYKHYSKWENIEDYDLVISNQDETLESEQFIKSKVLKELGGDNLTTLKDYNIKDGDHLRIVLRINDSLPASNTASVSHSVHLESNSASLKTNKSRNISKDIPMITFPLESTKKFPMHQLFDTLHEKSSQKAQIKCCYKTETQVAKDGGDVKQICLIYTQVLKTRIEQQIKNLFDDILDYELVPSCVLDLFTHFNNICKDDSVVFAVKSNSLILRFWIQLINNIDFLFDIPLVKHTPILECLKCISRVLMDICSENQNKDVWLTQLFSDVIKLYSPKVLNYYEGIKNSSNGNYNEYYSISKIEGINISLAIVLLYQNYIKHVQNELVDVIQNSNYPKDKQIEWINILTEVNNLYVPESFIESNGEIKTTIC